MVTICTTSLTSTNSTFCPHSVFMCFVWIWEQTAIISLYSINWLVFVTETECVYCAVRTLYLYTILISVYWPHIPGFTPRPVRVGSVVRKSGMRGFSPVLQFPPVGIILPTPHTHLHLLVALTGRTNGRSLGTFRKAMHFAKLGSVWAAKCCNLVCKRLIMLSILFRSRQ